jgi:hypothetical protein
MTPGYLLDTNVLSILAPQSTPTGVERSGGAAFRAWVREHDERLFLSVRKAATSSSSTRAAAGS